MKKIWIVGSLGHMGQALIRLLDMMEYELYETDKDELDITFPIWLYLVKAGILGGNFYVYLPGKKLRAIEKFSLLAVLRLEVG